MLTIKPEAFDEVRTAVAKVDALASAAEAAYDGLSLPQGTDRQQVERVAHLVGAAAAAAADALLAVDALNAELLDDSTSAKPGDWG